MTGYYGDDVAFYNNLISLEAAFELQEMQRHYDETQQINEDVANWLSFCFHKLEEDKESEIPRNPFYKSVRGPVTKDYVDRVIAAIDSYLAEELTKNANYHIGIQGTAKPPEYHRMTEYGKRAMVERLDQILGRELK